MRNAEVIRQWRILKIIEAGRYTTATTWPSSSASPSGPSGGTSRPCRRRASRSTTTAWTAARCGASSRATSSGSPRPSPCPSWPPSTSARTSCRSWAARPSPRTSSRPSRKIREALPAKSLPYLAPHPGPLLGPARSLQGLLEEAGRDHRPHRRDPAPAPGAHRLLLLQQQEDQDATPSTPTGSCTTAAASTSTRGPRSTARCAPSRSSASRRSRCSTQSFEMPADFNVTEYARGAFGIAGGKAGGGRAASSTPRWRATSASGSGTRARTSRTGPTARWS